MGAIPPAAGSDAGGGGSHRVGVVDDDGRGVGLMSEEVVMEGGGGAGELGPDGDDDGIVREEAGEGVPGVGGAGGGGFEGVSSGGDEVGVGSAPPKRPPTAYFMFTASRRGDEAFKGMGVAEAAKAMAAEWRGLSEDARGEFEAKARDAKARYLADLEAWKARGGGRVDAGSTGEGQAGGDGSGARGGAPSAGGSVVLPLARVKKLCKADPDVKNLSGDAVNLTAKATELFIAYLAEHAALAALRAKRRTVRATDLATAIRKQDHLGLFLGDMAEEIEVQAARSARVAMMAGSGKLGARSSPRGEDAGALGSEGTAGGGKRVRATKEQQLAKRARESVPGTARITAFFQKGARQFGTGEEGETQDDGGNAPLRRAQGRVGAKRGAFVLEDDEEEGGKDVHDDGGDQEEGGDSEEGEEEEGAFVAEKENVAVRIVRERAGRQAASRAARAERRMRGHEANVAPVEEDGQESDADSDAEADADAVSLEEAGTAADEDEEVHSDRLGDEDGEESMEDEGDGTTDQEDSSVLDSPRDDADLPRANVDSENEGDALVELKDDLFGDEE